MKQLIISCLLWMVTVQVAAQRYNLDSLLNLLETPKLTVTEQLESYVKICEVYQSSDPEKQLLYAEKGLSLAEKEKHKAYIAKFYSSIGAYYTSKLQFNTALSNFNTALEYAIAADDRKQEAVMYINLGALFNWQNNNPKSLEYYLKALSIYDEIGDVHDNRIIVLFNISNIYGGLKNKEHALSYLEKADSIAETVYAKMMVNYGFGNEYSDPEKRLEYYQKAYEMAVEVGHKGFQAAISQNIAEMYLLLGNTENSLVYIQKSLQLGEEIGHIHLIRGAYTILSEIYCKQNRWKEGEIAACKAWETDSTRSEHTNSIFYNLIASNIYFNHKEKATAYLTKFFDIIEDDLHNDDKLRESLSEMEVKYETEKKEMRIASLEQERKMYVWLGVAAVLVVFALGLALLLNIRSRRKERRLIASEAIQEGEIGERMRIADDLHDRLGSDLTAVKIGLSNAESLQSISEKLDTCMKGLREIMNNIIPRSLRLYGMKAALEDFCTQYANLQFHFFGEEKRIRHNLEYTVYCCAKELVNNSLKHSGASTVNLQLVQSKKHVSLTVQDDGCGFDERSVIKGDGLQNIRNRVASCRGKIDIASTPGKGTETVIELKTDS